MNPITTIVPCTNCGCGPVTCYRLWEVTLNCNTGQFGPMTDMEQVQCTTPPSLNWTLFFQSNITCRMRRWHPDGLGPPPLPTQAQIYSLCSCSNCTHQNPYGALLAVSGVPAIACHSALALATFGQNAADDRKATSPNGTYFSTYDPFTHPFLYADTNGVVTVYQINPNGAPVPNPGAPASCENFNQTVNYPFFVYCQTSLSRPSIDSPGGQVFFGGNAPISQTFDRCGRFKTLLWGNILPPGGQVLVTLLYPGDLP